MRSAWKCLRPVAVVVAMGACVLTSNADPGDEAKSTPERSAYVERLTGELQLETADDSKTPLARCEKSIQKWSWERNGFTDGQTYIWGLKGRPQAIGGAFLIPAEQKAHYEFVSLSPVPLICRRDGETVWTPPAVDLAWQEIPAAPKAAETPRARARQLGALAEKIGGVARMGPPRYAEGSRWELRLLPTPVYRYSDADQGVLDGAIFLMVMGTDPQLVLLIEAREEDRKTTWKAAFARLSGFELAASIGDKEIWQSPVVKDGHARDSVWHLSRPLDASKLFAK